MNTRRTTIIAALTLVASLLPVLSLTPAFAAPATDVVDLEIATWSAPAPEAGVASLHWRSTEEIAADDVVLIGADWQGPSRGRVEVRTTRDGAWSEWTPVERTDDEGPDLSGDEETDTGSDPVWLGSVDALQFRTTSSTPEALSIQAVRVEGGERALRRTPDAGTPSATAEATTARPNIITRSEWGADESKRNGETYYAPDVRFAIVHHTAGSNSYERWESDDIVRSIYRYHTDSRGWDDIGYNFLVDKYGQVFEGRAGGVERPVIGAHASGFNSGSTGIAVMGNFTDANAPAATLNALTRLLSWKLDLHHVNPLGTTEEVAGAGSRHREGSKVTLPTIVGHRDTGYTACPGDTIQILIASGDVANSVAKTGTPKLYTTLSSALFQPRSGELDIAIRASQKVTWRARVIDADGREVHASTGVASGIFHVVWDHKDTDGRLAPSGTYRLTVTASAGGAAALPVTASLTLVQDVPVGDPDARPVPPPTGATMLHGDWDGDGVDTPGWFKDGRWGMHDRSHAQGTTALLSYGQKGDVPVVGDWDGDGVDTVGVVRGNLWILRNEYRRGADDIKMYYGEPGDAKVAGDWDGDGTDTLGIVRGNLWVLRNEYRRGADDVVMRYGEPTDAKVTGDWDGNGTDTLGVVRGNLFILRSVYRRGADDVVMAYGEATDAKVVGDWDSDGKDTLGVVRDRLWILRNHYRRDAIDYVFSY